MSQEIQKQEQRKITLSSPCGKLERVVVVGAAASWRHPGGIGRVKGPNSVVVGTSIGYFSSTGLYLDVRLSYHNRGKVYCTDWFEYASKNRGGGYTIEPCYSKAYISAMAEVKAQISLLPAQAAKSALKIGAPFFRVAAQMEAEEAQKAELYRLIGRGWSIDKVEQVEEQSGGNDGEAENGKTQGPEGEEGEASADKGAQAKAKAQKPKRGKRSGRRSKRRKRQEQGNGVQAGKELGGGLSGPIEREAETVAKMPLTVAAAKKWLGGGGEKELPRYGMDVTSFVRALETGENPIPYLNKERPEGKLFRVLVSPDNSGSCGETFAPAYAVAAAIMAAPGLEVILIENCNGALQLEDGLSNRPGAINLDNLDVVLYLGDTDYLETGLSRETSVFFVAKNAKATLLGLDNTCSNYGDPKRVVELETAKNHLHIQRVYFNNDLAEVDADVAKALTMAKRYLKF